MDSYLHKGFLKGARGTNAVWLQVGTGAAQTRDRNMSEALHDF